MSRPSRRDVLAPVLDRSALLDVLRQLAEPALLLVVDLDGMRSFNTRFGLPAGDQRLREAAAGLAQVISPRQLYRTGDDEFAWLEAATADPSGRAQQVLHGLSTRRPDLRVRVGWVVAQGGDASGSALAHASAAVVAAKHGAAGVGGFTDADAATLRRRETVAHGLSAALHPDERQLHLVFQPIARLADGHVVAVEALARWQHPALGVITPDEFVTVAEQSGQSCALDLWVMARALVHLPELVGAPLVHVNISAASLTAAGFTSDLLDLIGTFSVEPARLCLELTETALANDRARLRHAVETLHAEGFRISIDDFGTGHASWSYLNELPVDELKLDRSFIQGIGSDERRAAVVRAVVELAKACGQQVVAEGIELPEEASTLLALGCPLGQGYLLGRPAAAPEPSVVVPPWARRSSGGPIQTAQAQVQAEAVAVPSQRATVRVAQEADGAQRLSDLAQLLSAAPGDPESVFQLTITALRWCIDFTGGSLQLAGPDGVRLAAADPPPPSEALLARLPFGQGVAGTVLSTGRPVYLPDITRSAAVPAGRRVISGGVRSYLAMPLFQAGRAMGVLQIDSTFVDAFSTEDRLQFSAAASLVGAALVKA